MKRNDNSIHLDKANVDASTCQIRKDFSRIVKNVHISCDVDVDEKEKMKAPPDCEHLLTPQFFIEQLDEKG